MVTDKQVRRLFDVQHKHEYQYQVADAAGMSSKTARKYLQRGKLPSQCRVDHTWSTRQDPFSDDWDFVKQLLEDTQATLEAKTIFDYLQRAYPGKYHTGQLRTLQRRIKAWKALYGPSKEIFFSQHYHPGQVGTVNLCKKINVSIVFRSQMRYYCRMLTKHKKVRLKDIAQKSGVSIPTVSRALSNHPQISEYTKKLVEKTGKELGYSFPPRKLTNSASNGRNSVVSKRFGFMVIGTKLQDEVHTDLLNSLIKATSARNIRLEIAALENNETSEDIADQVEVYSRELDGIMLMGWVDPVLVKRLHNAKIPNLVIGDVSSSVNNAVAVSQYAHIVRPDDILAGHLATASLIAAGHKKVGFICEYLQEGLSYDHWHCGYWLAYRNTGFFPKPQWLHVAGKPYSGGKPAAKTMLSLADSPRAYVIPDSRTAESFLEEMRKGGVLLQKKDVVVGGLNHMIHKYGLEGYPCISHDVNELAEVSVDHMLQLSNHPSSSGLEILVPSIMQNMPGAL